MFTKEYIAQMAPAIFADMQAKGFHNAHRSPTIIQGLIASEIIEGFEALRKGRRAAHEDVDFLKHSLSVDGRPVFGAKEYGEYYARTVKDTVEAEMAGTCIRCFDAIGMRLHEGGGQIEDIGVGRADGLTLEVIAEVAAKRVALCLTGAIEYTDAENVALFPEILVATVPVAMGIQTAPTDYTQHGLAPYITELNSFVETLANMARIATYYGVDLLTFIELEVAYNRTRAYQHGGKGF